jgi:phage-related holin
MEKLEELIIKFCPTFVIACWIEVKYLFVLLLVLLLIDNITAIYQCYKFKESKKQWFNYKKLKTTAEKFVLYGLVLIVSWILEKIFNQKLGLPNIMAGYLAIIEAYSISRHVGIILKMNVFVSIMDLLIEKTGFKSDKKLKNK